MKEKDEQNKLKELVDSVRINGKTHNVAIIGGKSQLATIEDMLLKINDIEIIEIPDHITSSQSNNATYIIPTDKEIRW